MKVNFSAAFLVLLSVSLIGCSETTDVKPVVPTRTEAKTFDKGERAAKSKSRDRGEALLEAKISKGSRGARRGADEK